MISVTFQGFKSLAHAEAFASWYEGQGEQDSPIWLEAAGVPDAYIDSAVKTIRTSDSITLTIR